MASLWIPATAILSVAILAAYSAQLSDTVYWTLTSIPIAILFSWKMRVRRQTTLQQELEPTPEQIAKLRPHGYLFLSIYFFSTLAFIGYTAAVWYYQLALSWTFFITFLCLFAIKIEVWTVLLKHALSESTILSQRQRVNHE